MSASAAQKLKADNAYRVMIVDDSAVIRGLVTRWLETDPGITVVATAHNGLSALRALKSAQPEVVILDIEMPEMDGMTALPKIIETMPGVKVIMASTLTRRNAEISLKALEAGAADYIPKPEASRFGGSEDFRALLTEKVKALGAVARQERTIGPAAVARRPVADSTVKPYAIRPITSKLPPRILAVGSSTGGPQALLQFLEALKPAPAVPVIVTQHMPPTFTAILAEHLTRATGIPCKEAADGDKLEPGKVYIARGDYHMVVKRRGHAIYLQLTQDPPENFCRPAVDPMFRSVAKEYGPSALAVVLTGMGSDGAKGAKDIVDAGGTLLAQDEATSVVWGMPGAVAQAGLASAILPLKELGRKTADMTAGARP